MSQGAAGGEEVEMLGGEEEREEDSKGGQAQGRSFQDRKPVSVGCWKLTTGSQRGRAKMGEPESQEPGFVSGDFHAKQEKPRGTGSVLARMLLVPPSSSDPAQPSERIQGLGVQTRKQFIQQTTFIEHLLYAKHHAEHWVPALSELRV